MSKSSRKQFAPAHFSSRGPRKVAMSFRKKTAQMQSEATLGNQPASREKRFNPRFELIVARPGVEFPAAGVGDFDAQAVPQLERSSRLGTREALEGNPARVVR